jgi:hypothetical protein
MSRGIRLVGHDYNGRRLDPIVLSPPHNCRIKKIVAKLGTLDDVGLGAPLLCRLQSSSLMVHLAGVVNHNPAGTCT